MSADAARLAVVDLACECSGLGTDLGELPSIQRRVTRCDLSFLYPLLRRDEGWTYQQCADIEAKYKEFLSQVIYDRRVPFAISRSVDRFWHSHILATEAYFRFCEEVAGFYIHHRPTFNHNSQEQQVMVSHEVGEPVRDGMADCFSNNCDKVSDEGRELASLFERWQFGSDNGTSHLTSA